MTNHKDLFAADLGPPRSSQKLLKENSIPVSDGVLIAIEDPLRMKVLMLKSTINTYKHL